MISVRELLAFLGVVLAALLSVALIYLALAPYRSQPDPGYTPRPTPPATVTVDGYTFQCAQVAQLVSQGEWYTPDGHHIPAILLADCDI